MKIQIYGTGCEKCKKLATNVQQALEMSGLKADVKKVTDMKAIAEAGVFLTPALAIEGKIVSSGKVLSPDEITIFLKPADCSNAGKKKQPLIFSCGGAADVGELSDRAARKLTREGAGRMFCIVGIGGRVPGIMETTKAADDILAIDGCPLQCVKNSLEQAGFTNFKHLKLWEYGFEKGQSPATEDAIQKVADAANEMPSRNHSEMQNNEILLDSANSCCGSKVEATKTDSRCCREENASKMDTSSFSCCCGQNAKNPAPDQSFCCCNQKKGRKWLLFLLLLIMIGSLVFMAVRESKAQNKASQNPHQPPASAVQNAQDAEN